MPTLSAVSRVVSLSSLDRCEAEYATAATAPYVSMPNRDRGIPHSSEYELVRTLLQPSVGQAKGVLKSLTCDQVMLRELRQGSWVRAGWE